MKNFNLVFSCNIFFISVGLILYFIGLENHTQQLPIMTVGMIMITIGASANDIVKFAYRLNLKIKTHKSKKLADLKDLYFRSVNLEAQLMDVKNKIAKYPADPEAFIFLSNYIKTLQEEPEQMKGTKMSQIFYDIDNRLKEVEKFMAEYRANQGSTTKENTPKSDKIIF